METWSNMNEWTEYYTGNMRSLALSPCRLTLMLWQPGEPHCPLVWHGFIDGTVRPISRPEEHHQPLYNGHIRVHALKFQSVALPNGLIGNLYGPIGKLKTVQRTTCTKAGMWLAFWLVAGLINAWHQMLIFVQQQQQHLYSPSTHASIHTSVHADNISVCTQLSLELK